MAGVGGHAWPAGTGGRRGRQADPQQQQQQQQTPMGPRGGDAVGGVGTEGGAWCVCSKALGGNEEVRPLSGRAIPLAGDMFA